MDQSEKVFLQVLGLVTLASLLMHYATETLFPTLKKFLYSLIDIVLGVVEKIKKRK